VVLNTTLRNSHFLKANLLKSIASFRESIGNSGPFGGAVKFQDSPWILGS